MVCISTVTYSFKVNGDPVGFVRPKRGIRQGDPLSPYLFVICAKGLSGLLRRSEALDQLHGIKICKEAPSIHHLLFADDRFLFARGSLEECVQIRQLLRAYEVVSDQAVNFEKSCVAFSTNLTKVDQQVLADCVGVQRVSHHDKYLRLPVFVWKSKKQTFACVKDRIWKKLHGWRGDLLSTVGRELLIKIVAQSLPMYSMQCFLLPKTFCAELNMMLAKFWWSGEPGKKKIHWIDWRTLCKPKWDGGLGFRDLYAFNLALLAKQAWRLVRSPDSFVGIHKVY